MQTRRATLNDIPWLLEQLWAFDEFLANKHSMIPFEEGKATEILAFLIQEHYFLMAETPGGTSCGFIAGVRGPHILNPEIVVLTELFWWVLPDARCSRAGATLLAEFIEYGRHHANWVVMTLEHNSPINPESLHKRGFRLKESNYLLEV